MLKNQKKNLLDERAIPGPTTMVCYFGSWSVYRPGNGKFDVEQIEADLCTHVIYGFAALDNYTMVISYRYDYRVGSYMLTF